MRDEVEILAGWQPGAIGDMVAMHSRYYALHWNFGPYFEAKVAGELAAFVRDRHRSPSQLWCAVDSRERMVGSVAIDGAKGLEAGAHLRWFMVDPNRQGMGAGSRLLDTALDFCRDKGFASVHLWTFDGLYAARRLYEARGFALTQEMTGETWGKPVTEQCFELELAGSPCVGEGLRQ
jgi:GNAT superfamily N-acetyltransferase